MRHIGLTILGRDVNTVIEFLGRAALMHLDSGEEDSGSPAPEGGDYKHIQESLEKLAAAAAWLEVPLPPEPVEESRFPGEAEEALTGTVCRAVADLSGRETRQREEKRKVEEALTEAKAFANLNAPFSDLDQLSYLTLRIGRLDPRRHDELKENLAGRAVVVPLGEGSEGRILAAASRKGRFALDSELEKMNFVPIAIPEGYKGVPAELLSGLEARLGAAERELEDIRAHAEKLREDYGKSLQSLAGSYLLAGISERLKSRLVSTQSVYFLSGWVPAGKVRLLAEGLDKCAGGRVAIRAFTPEELEEEGQGREKVPVALEHRAFVRGFERLVFSYGAPLYGTVDPTPLVAVFFTVLFGIMFGDLGQGFVLLLLGFLTGRRGPAILSSFKNFSVPLIAVGCSSMVMGLLNGSVFCNEQLLVGATRSVTGFLFGRPVDRILTIMPLAGHGGSVAKLFYFFAFTIGVGVILNSAGLIVNMLNLIFLKRYEKALFSKTGLSGIIFFWYALSIGIRFAAAKLSGASPGFAFRWFDTAALILPVLGIVLGPALWRLAAGESPVFEEGLTVYIMEGFVEILETVSTFISNTVSFLRVGAFALSHAVLSYIVFLFSEKVSAAPAGLAASLLVFIFGNTLIILLEGMIVAIQVLRLQYYEFFNKFFTETGVEFSPFRFRKEAPSEQAQ